MRKHIIAATALSVVAIAGLSACDGSLFGSAGGYKMGKYACSSKATLAGVKSTLFRKARELDPAAEARVNELEQGSVTMLEQPVLDQVERETEKTLCSATLAVSLPPGTKKSKGLEELQKIPVRFSIQPTADGKESLYQIFGADDLIAGLAGKKPAMAAKTVPAVVPSTTGVATTVAATKSVGSYYYLHGLDPNGDNWLALRPEPNMASPRSAKLGPETLLISDGTRVGQWLKVETLDGRKGWVAARFTACCRQAL